MEASKVDRRRFLKYVGAGAIAAGGATAAYYLYNRSLGRNPEATIATTTQTSRKVNHPPVASFTRKPFYLNPTDQQAIQFTSTCYDADNDPLQYAWYVDGEQRSVEKNYSTKLSAAEHAVELRVSDGMVGNSAQQKVTVEADQIYPAKQLHINYKGMRMMVGWKGMPRTPMDITEEKLDIIHNELGCNAVIIFGNTEFEDDLIEAGRVAIGKGFDRIYIAPMYLDLPVDETVENIGKFARKVKTLREMSDSIVFMVGHEFTMDAYGIVPGETYAERSGFPYEHPEWMRSTYWKMLNSVLPHAFKRIIALCRENYGYQIAYAATIDEAESIVPWSDPIFESVGSDAYIWDKIGLTGNWVVNHLSGLKRFGKPVNSTEWGCLTYKGAIQGGWEGFWLSDTELPAYDEDEQARYIAQYCGVLNRARISGAFYTQMDDERLKGYGLYKVGYGSASRKKGFYMYKSYQRG
jgi:hypothetical protein